MDKKKKYMNEKDTFNILKKVIGYSILMLFVIIIALVLINERTSLNLEYLINDLFGLLVAIVTIGATILIEKNIKNFIDENNRPLLIDNLKVDVNFSKKVDVDFKITISLKQGKIKKATILFIDNINWNKDKDEKPNFLILEGQVKEMGKKVCVAYKDDAKISVNVDENKGLSEYIPNIFQCILRIEDTKGNVTSRYYIRKPKIDFTKYKLRMDIEFKTGKVIKDIPVNYVQGGENSKDELCGETEVSFDISTYNEYTIENYLKLLQLDEENIISLSNEYPDYSEISFKYFKLNNLDVMNNIEEYYKLYKKNK